ncbi:hypothetical protein DRP04_14020, partial [Archaeoglobales archaeon]
MGKVVEKFSNRARAMLPAILALLVIIVMAGSASAANADLTPDYAKAGTTDVPILEFDVEGTYT